MAQRFPSLPPAVPSRCLCSFTLCLHLGLDFHPHPACLPPRVLLALQCSASMLPPPGGSSQAVPTQGPPALRTPGSPRVTGGGSCRSPPGGAGSGPLAPGPSLSAPLFALRCVWLSLQLFPPLEEGAVSLDRRCDALWPRQTWSLSEHPVSAPPARVPGGAEGGRVRAPAQRSATASHGLAATLGTFIVPAAPSAEAA